MADIETIRSETERLVAVANDRLLDSVKRSYRQLFRAEWHEGEQGQAGYYDVDLSCGHSFRVTWLGLQTRMMCLECVKEKLL